MIRALLRLLPPVLLVLSTGALSACGVEGTTGEAEPAPCVLALAAPEELRSIVDSASGRLYAATGCELTADPEGIPVSHEPVVHDLQGVEVCGFTTIGVYQDNREVAGVYSIQLDWDLAGCPTAEADLLHEAIHGLVNPPGAELEESHAESGLFAARTQSADPKLNIDTLDFLCSRANCAWMQPEE